MLPATVAWSFDGAAPATPAVITGGDGPFAQRVAYGTTDGRVHLRALATGAEIGPPGGTAVADAAVTDMPAALSSPFVSSSTDAAPGILYVIHDDGGGVEIARFDEVTGQRLGFDAALPSGLGCEEAGAPLLTPPATDGTRLLFFTVEGPCSAGEGLVRVPVEADGTLGTPATGRVDDPAADPVLLVSGDRYLVAVGRVGGIDLFAADGTLMTPVASAAVGTPVAIANDAGELLVLVDGDDGARVHRLTAAGVPAGSSPMLTGAAAGLAVGATRIVVATASALHVLRRDLTAAVSVPGKGAAPAVAGAYAYQPGRAVRLEDGAVSELPPASVGAAIARGFVVFGPLALATTDATAPAITAARGLAATVAEDRGVASVRFTVRGRSLIGRTGGGPWAPARYTAAVPTNLAPGPHPVGIRVTDVAGNAASATTRLRVGCDRRRAGARGADRLRGGPRRDCIDARGGADVVLVAGGGADRVRCGPGRDRVRADQSDRLAIDCEVVKRRASR